MLHGYDAFARITSQGGAPVRYAIGEYTFDVNTELQDVTNSEGIQGRDFAPNSLGTGRAKSVMDSPGGVKVMLKSVTLDISRNPFAAPLSLDAGDYIFVEIFPDGHLGGTGAFAAWVCIGNIRVEGNVKTLQPVTIEGESDGAYFLPA